MIRIPFLRSAIALGALSVPLIACAGRVVSIGSNADQLTAVAPASVSGSVGVCPDGYQHPNICCSGGPSESSSCGAYINKPFRPCDAGSTTYPNALSCCSLSDGSCIDAPSSTTPPPTIPPGVCTSVCPPGWWPAGPGSAPSGGGTPSTDPSAPGSSPPSGSGSGTATALSCCRSAGNGDTECVGGGSTGSADGPPNGGCIDPVPSPIDAGVDDGGSTSPPPGIPGVGCGPTDAGTTAPPPPPPPGTCTIPCPAGWTSQPGAPDVCCRDNGDGTGECFSQSSGGWAGSPGSQPGQPEKPNPAPDGGPTSGRD